MNTLFLPLLHVWSLANYSISSYKRRTVDNQISISAAI